MTKIASYEELINELRNCSIDDKRNASVSRFIFLFFFYDVLRIDIGRMGKDSVA